MGWERRGNNGCQYFYHSHRTPEGKVVKEYCGRGERANDMALALARSRSRQHTDRNALQGELARLSSVDRQTAELVEVARLLLEATLMARGFHRCNYETWRKSHDSKERKQAEGRAQGSG